MDRNQTLWLPNSRLLDLSTYLGTLLVTLLGAQGLPGTGQRLAALGLGVAVALVYYGRQRVDSLPPVLYFGVQAGLVGAMFTLGTRLPDMFNFLLYILSIQAALVLPPRTAAAWIGLFFVLTCAWVLAYQGPRGLPAMVFFAVVYVFCGIFGHSLREAELARLHNQELLEALQSTQAQLQTLAVVEERQRLSREMHDSLGHRLTVAVVQLEGAERLIPADPGRAAGMVHAMRDELKEALAELRQMVAALRSEGLPLDVALRRLARRFEAGTGLTVGLQLPAAVPALPPAHALTLFRAAQEGLTNVQRHAAAQHVDVTLTLAEGGIGLTVTDDGQGHTQPDAAENGGFGLRGLRERLAALGGRLGFERGPAPAGARLAVWLPLAQPTGEE
jgi:signal transduction histidine kinase